MLINDTDLSREEVESLLASAPEAEQGSEEWYEERLGRVTASRVKDVVWRDRYGKPYKAYDTYMMELIAERITGKRKRFSAGVLEWGKTYEEEAANLYEEITGNEISTSGFVKIDGIEAGASPDRLVGDDGTVEIKCPNTDTYVKYVLEGKVPNIYYDQIQWQLYATGRQWCDFVSYDPEVQEPYPSIFIVRVERDDEYIACMVERVKEFLALMNEKLQKLRDYSAVE